MKSVYYHQFSPNAVLKPYIRSYFFINSQSAVSHLPADGCPGLIINLKDPFLLGFKQNQLAPFHGIRLFGAQTRCLMTEPMTGQTVLMAVKFNPGQLPVFFKLAASELTDTSVSIHNFMGKHDKYFEQKCCEAKNIASLKTILDRTFIKLLAKENAFDARITAALSSIWHHKGHLTIDKLAASLHLSCRHLERLFLNYIGLPPKRMCRIIRFLSIFSSSKITEKSNWADLAIANGFSDQAHLIRECKYFSGKSPFSYLTNRSPFEQTIIGPCAATLL